MRYCINPHCPNPLDPANANTSKCCNCGFDLLLQNRYWVVERLGKGGFGNTWVVDDRGTPKVLKVLTDNNSKAIELFRQEAQVLSLLKHPGIPKVDSDGYFTVLPQGSSAPLHCLVMEKIEGVDLEQWMQSRHNQPISQTQALDWLKQLVEILSLIHSQQYFHRDIKPQNIMLRPNGQLVLIDFGAVRQVTTTILAGVCHTRIVSRGYSPPEQQNGYSVQQSDFFALGRTFVFLLTGKDPQDVDIYDPFNNKLNWRNYALHISPLLADLIDYLMAPTANQRPQNTQVILRCLQKIEQDLSQPNTLLQIFQKSALPLATTAISHPNWITKQLWKVLIGSGVGFFTVSALIISFNGVKKQVSTTTPDSVITPIVTPASVPLVTKQYKYKKPQKIRPLFISNSNKITLKQKRTVVSKEKPKKYLVKAKANIPSSSHIQPKKRQAKFTVHPKRLTTLSQRKNKLTSKLTTRSIIQLRIGQEIKINLNQGKSIKHLFNKKKIPELNINLPKPIKSLIKQKIHNRNSRYKFNSRMRVKLKTDHKKIKK
ncbi:serine/threonine-protein kinase [Chlorogloeopsis sp. ULAP01]|uniref:serine/threonine-protein kinase n=1 Tax=Chlorogloeopsis sp. ULAP01 TaxID=3056483 RepID=UPI0025AB47A8|nr:serine/threonine-protein kinase [Chlorogloeopsis sp. ULAP01]MDM9382440.1 serine/threonine-protein kinase [Chlorogloeopsis sp. ULAP01]